MDSMRAGVGGPLIAVTTGSWSSTMSAGFTTSPARLSFRTPIASRSSAVRAAALEEKAGRWDNLDRHLRPEQGLPGLYGGLSVFANERPATLSRQGGVILDAWTQRSKSPSEGSRSGVITAAWTRKAKGPLEPPKGKKSWKQRHEKYLKPFIMDVFISNKYVHAKVVHRLTSKVIAVATTNAKDLRFSLYSLSDENACKVIGKLLAERTIEADVFAVTFNLRKQERFEGKLALVVNTVVENGVALV